MKVKKTLSKALALALAVVLLVPLMCGAFAVDASAESSQPADGKYPTVLIHGFLGWGPEDDIDGIMPYWGMTSGDMLGYINGLGAHAYAASVGPLSSCWDRCCELYAQLTGTRTDYGQAHCTQAIAEFKEVGCSLGHERYGRDYTGNALFEGWGPIYKNGKVTGWYDNKINLVGHSFGGPTSTYFLYLLAEGDAAERDWAKQQAAAKGGDWHDYCSPLFWGDYNGNELVNCIVSLAGVLNGTTFIDACDHSAIAVTTLMDLMANAIGGTPFNGVYDFQLEQFGITKSNNPDYHYTLDFIRSAKFLDGYDNLFCVGRNGQFDAMFDFSAKVADVLEGLHAPVFEDLRTTLVQAKGRGEELLQNFNDDLPLTVREGGMIRPGANAELDAMNADIKERREWIASLEGRERERLGIPTLKVGYNRVFGYYIEITRAQMAKATQPIPEEYIRKQTTVNGERYITPEMKECESIISNAEVNIHALEYKIFCELRERVNGWRAELQNIADAIARVDSLYSFARAARKYNYVCPEVFEGTGLEIRGGFHPVIVAVNPDLDFVPNDVCLSPDGTRLMLITGPNMAGKSTYLRQTGLIVLMAQIGCFVPAESARIGVVDRIFTRVGASDRLSRGLSTFMVEMIETANILRNATPHSLVLLDEIGRGTSTFDGLSIAWSIVETLHTEPARMALTLFATHYHELTGLVESLEHAGNFQVAVQEKGEKLVFLHKILAGACDSSYGIHVAEMAGLPNNVVRRARKILLRLEKQKIDPSDEAAHKKIVEKPQMDLFAPLDENTQLLKDEIRRLKPDEMTPMQALQCLMDLKEHYGK